MYVRKNELLHYKVLIHKNVTGSAPTRPESSGSGSTTLFFEVCFKFALPFLFVGPFKIRSLPLKFLGTGGFFGFVFYVLHSTLPHLPPLRFHCVVEEDAGIEPSGL
jgi:hypothetical protein